MKKKINSNFIIIIIKRKDENNFFKKEIKKNIKTKIRYLKIEGIIKLKIVPSKPKWGILKYLSAEISSETTKLLGLENTNKRLFNCLKYE